MSIELTARETAIAWLNAFFACSQDDERPTLYRTVSIELFRTGVQFVSTNGHAFTTTIQPPSTLLYIFCASITKSSKESFPSLLKSDLLA